MSQGKLHIVATPIGNLSDITLRALDTLKSVGYILCEDTRVTRNLLEHYKIDKPLISYHQHSDSKKIREIRQLLENGKDIALVTDAGTPGISDPGNILISELVRTETGGVSPIPGACAAIAALSVSGFPTDKFVFMGFPPQKNKRQKYLKEVAGCQYTVVFYESGHRIMKCLKELEAIIDPDREMLICRELTKKFETLYRGKITKLVDQIHESRGEFVVVIKPIK